MNIRRLETFLQIVRVGSFAGAAAKLNATQSTISTRIQELEQELGVDLFDRSQRKATLTAKGQELVRYAEQAVLLSSEIKQTIGTRDRFSGLVRLGVAELVAITWLPAMASQLHAKYPRVTLEFDVALTMPLRDRLQAGMIDVALIPGDVFDRGYVARSLGAVSFRWMAGANFFAPDRRLLPEDFEGTRILSLGEDSFHNSTINDWLQKSKVQATLDVCNSMSVIASLTSAGLGVSLLPPSCYQREIAEGSLRVLNTDPVPADVEFFVVYPAKRMNMLEDIVTQTALEVSTFGR